MGQLSEAVQAVQAVQLRAGRRERSSTVTEEDGGLLVRVRRSLLSRSKPAVLQGGQLEG